MADNVLEKTIRLRDNFTKGMRNVDQWVQRTTVDLEKLRDEGNRRMEIFLSTDKAQDGIEKMKNSYAGMTDALKDEIVNQQSQLDALSDKIAATAKKSRMAKVNLGEAVKEGDQEKIVKYQTALANTDMQLLKSGDSVRKFEQHIAMLNQALIELESTENKVKTGLFSSESMGFSKIQKAISWTQTLIDKIGELGTKTKSLAFKGLESGMDVSSRKLDGLMNKMNQLRVSSTKLSSGNVGSKMFDGAYRGAINLQKRIDGLRGGLGKVNSNLLTKSLNGSARAAGMVTQSLRIIGRNGATAFSTIGRGIGNVISKTVQLPRNIARATSSMLGLNRETQKTGNSMKSLQNISRLLTFGAAIAAAKQLYNTIDSVAQKADEIVNTQSKFKILLDDKESKASLEDMNNAVFAAAQRSRSSWQDTANFVSRMGINAGDAFGNIDEILAFSENLNKAYKVGGATAQEQAASMIQLEQAMAQGVLQGQELRSVLQGAPQIAKAIADYMGVSVGELKELGKEGEISAQVVKNAVLGATDQINEKFKQIPMTWETMWTSVKNVALQAFLPLVEKFNEFINSDMGQQLFQNITTGIIFMAQVASVAFDVMIMGINWVMENLGLLANVLTAVAIVAAAVGAIMAISFLVANWPILLIIALVWLVIDVLNGMGISTQQIIAFMAGAFAFLATVIYNAVQIAIGAFATFFTSVWNWFIILYNNVISWAEFFMNVWNNPVYSVKKLFYNLVKDTIGYFAAFVDSTYKVGEAIAKAFLWGANKAVQGINWIIEALNKIPGVDIGTIGEFSTDVDFSGAGDKMRGWAEKLNPGEEPDNYKSLDHLKGKFKKTDRLNDAIENAKDPMAAFDAAYNMVNGFSLPKAVEKEKDLNDLVDKDAYNPLKEGIDGGVGGVPNYDPSMGAGKDKVDKVGKVGQVDKIKDEVDISDEDLKYMRDVAEKAFTMNYRQVTPNATLNIYGKNNDSDLDENALLDKMERMILDQVASELT